MKPGKFDGAGSLEYFSAQFEICALYNRWSDDDIGDFLRCALDKAATQLLWDVGARENVSYEQLVDRLRQRYGVEGQAETFGFSSIIDANVLMRLSTRHSPSRSIGVSSSL